MEEDIQNYSPTFIFCGTPCRQIISVEDIYTVIYVVFYLTTKCELIKWKLFLLHGNFKKCIAYFISWTFCFCTFFA